MTATWYCENHPDTKNAEWADSDHTSAEVDGSAEHVAILDAIFIAQPCACGGKVVRAVEE